MVLIIDLIAIIFIVIISCVMCMNINKTQDNKTKHYELSYIVVGLSVIVFYKLVRYFKLSDKVTNTNEHFNGFGDSNSLNNFISSNNLISPEQASKLSSDDYTSYVAKLDTIIDNINSLQNTISAPKEAVIANPANLSTMDLSSQQQYQMFQIDYLNKQIKNAQDVLNAQQIANTTSNYKPIKVFSSCVVSNANGTTTDKPVSPFSNVLGLSPSPADLSNPSTQQMMQTIGQSNSQTTGPALNLSTTAGALGDIFNKIANSGNINLNVN